MSQLTQLETIKDSKWFRKGKRNMNLRMARPLLNFLLRQCLLEASFTEARLCQDLGSVQTCCPNTAPEYSSRRALIWTHSLSR